MIPEYGHMALILALCLAVCLSTLPLVGAARGQVFLMDYARPLAWGQLFFLSVSFGCLVYAFVTDDFSVLYVANNSNSLLPTAFKVSAVWGAHEGSLLLWVLILALWTFAVSVFSKHLPLVLVARVLAVMGIISVGFLLFTLLTSNPFERILPQSPVDGADLNPLLQDVGLILHPPMLYMGYVGFSVAFAFAVAALLGGRLDSTWARWSRPWTNWAWVFLTVGIALGSYWAYYELGWGGWWFWDPVENASFMPWLVGTALVHSLAVTDKRGVFKSWTVLLAIFAFSLSLLGTFLVRSGVLTSVHAFASDPERGVFILIFLALVVGGSLTLYGLRVSEMQEKGVTEAKFTGMSRETLLLINNVILVVSAAAVLLGTLYPLLVDAFGGGRVSVGPPYFNLVFIPLMCLLFAFIGLAPASRWKTGQITSVQKLIVAGIILATVLVQAGIFDRFDNLPAGAALGVLLALWITYTIVKDIYQKSKGSFAGLARLSRSFWAMHIAHLGLAICVIGVAFNDAFSDERDVRMVAGDSLTMAGYRFEFQGIEKVRGPNYLSDWGVFKVESDSGRIFEMNPEKRLYSARQQVMTEAAIDSGITRDLYISLGEPLDQGAWAVRLYYKAFVNWIWVGSIFMSIGGILATADRRYRLKKKSRAAIPTGNEAVQA